MSLVSSISALATRVGSEIKALRGQLTTVVNQSNAAVSKVNSLISSNRALIQANAGQTSFPIAYNVGFVDVWINGVKQVIGHDFTADTGVSIVLTEGADADDWVEMIAYGSANTITATSRLVLQISSASQTSFSINYSSVDVWINGIKQINGHDFTANNGTTVVLTDPPTVLDWLDIIAYA